MWLVIAAIFKTVSAVLMFGNMQFKQERSNDQATLPDNTVAQQVSIYTNSFFEYTVNYLFLVI